MFKSLEETNESKSRFGTKITTKLVLAMMLAAAVPLLISGFVINRTTTDTLREQTGRQTTDLALTAANAVAQELAQNVSLLEAMTVSEAMRQQLIASNNSYTGSPAEIATQVAGMDAQWRANAEEGADNPLVAKVMNKDTAMNYATAMLVEYKQRYPRFAELFVTDRYGANIAATDRTSDYYQADEFWWQYAFDSGRGRAFISDPEYDQSARVTAVNVAVPVKDAQGAVIGVLRGTINNVTLDVVRNLSTAKLGQTGQLLIVNDEGKIIFDPTRPEVTDAKLPGELILRGALIEDGWIEESSLRRTSAIVGHAKASNTFDIPILKKLNWTVVASIESGEAYVIAQRQTRVQIIVLLLAVLLACGIAFFVARRLTGQVKYISELFERIKTGDFTARAPVVSRDELGRMTADLNTMLDQTLTLIQSREERDEIQQSVMKLLEEVSDVANGDLTVEAEVTADATGAIADAFNYMILELRQVITNVKNATLEVSSSASQIQATTEHLAHGSEAQALQIGDTSLAIEEMAQSIQQVSENAVMSATVADQALANARQGASAVQNNINAMGKIRDQVQETAKRIKRLGERSQEIGEIVGVIDDIADRTSLLALNASIQAAMAGEAGRGFAVVAEEVERLAERSTNATKQIATLIKAIQSETNEAVSAMEDTTREVVDGSSLANDAGRALGEIEQVSQRLATIISSISQASKQQARGSEELARSMTGISGVTQQVASGTKQAAVSVRSLVSLADNLRGSVVTFKLPEEAARAAETMETAETAETANLASVEADDAPAAEAVAELDAAEMSAPEFDALSFDAAGFDADDKQMSVVDVDDSNGNGNSHGDAKDAAPFTAQRDTVFSRN